MSLLYNYYIQRPVVGIRLALMNINEMQGMRSGLHTRVSLEAASSSAISMSYSTPTNICWGVRSRTSSDSEKLLVLKSRIRGDALSQIINSVDLSSETDYKEFVKKIH